MKSLLAGGINVAPPGGFRGFGPLGLEGLDPQIDAPRIFNQLFSTVIGVMTVIAFIWFTIQFILGAIGIMTSGGDKAALESAKKKLTTGIIGLVVVIAAIFLINLIGYILGVELILNPALFVERIRTGGTGP